MLRRQDVPARVLFHLGVTTALAACGRAEPPVAPTSPASTVEVAPTSGAPVSTFAAPPPSASAPPRSPKVGAQCRSDSDCGGGLFCELGFNGAEFSKEPGRCVTERPVYEGRPLMVDGAAHVARGASGGARASGLAAALRASAFEEHASVAAFARTICELMALGAPLGLLAKTERALADEIRHARETFAWLEAISGERTEPGRLDAAASSLRSGPALAAELLRDVFRGGCVGETLAACRAAERASRGELGPRGAELAAFFSVVAEDEARHAALAFETALWLVDRFPDVRPVLDEEIARFRGEASAAERATLEPLLAVFA